MIYVSEKQAEERWDLLPQVLREALFSEFVADTAEKIYADHHIDDIKAEKINRVCALVLMGFLHPEELSQDIKEELNLPKEVADPLAADLEKKIFAQYSADIQKIYDPAVRTSAAEAPEKAVPKTISLDNIGESKPEPIPVEPPAVTLKPNETAKEKSNAPFMLHEENPAGAPAAASPIRRSIISPLGGFFKRKAPEETGARGPLFAKLEIPGLKPEEKRVVHYSETRTPIGESEEPAFIHFEERTPLREETPTASPAAAPTAKPETGVTLKPQAVPEPARQPAPAPAAQTAAPMPAPTPVPANAPATAPAGAEKRPEILGAIRRPEPKVEGNTIDLKGDD